MNVIVILQARMGSTRLPGKVLADVAGRPMLEHVIERAARIPHVTTVVLATSADPANEPLIGIAGRLGIASFAGSESDVLDRYYRAARQVAGDVIVRVTADCPLLDPEVSGLVVDRFLHGDFDYVSNTNPPTYPDGLDTEVFSFAALERAWREASLPSEREHVTPYLWKSPDRFRNANVASDVDRSSLRWTVDHPEDLEFVQAVYAAMAARKKADFGMNDVLDLLATSPDLGDVNRARRRNDGYQTSLTSDRSSAHAIDRESKGN